MKIVPTVGKLVKKDVGNTILTLAQMKSICYIDTEITDDDTMLERMEIAARNLCEKFLGRPLLTSTTTLWYTQSQIHCLMQTKNPPVLDLPLGELQDIGDVSVYDITDTASVLTLNTDYTKSLQCTEGARVNFLNSPFTYSSSIRDLDAVGIEVTAGFGDTTDVVPEELKHGMEFLIAYWYEHREDQKMGSITSAAKAMWSPYKLQRFK